MIQNIVIVVTKNEISRNKAIFRNNEELFDDIGQNIVKAVKTEAKLKCLIFPSVMEKSFKRVEDASKWIEHLRSYNMDANYLKDEVLGYDAHTVVCKVNNIDEFIKSI